MARAARTRTAFLREHPDVTQSILQRIQAQLGDDQIASARLLPVAEPADQEKPRRRRRRPRPAAGDEAEAEEGVDGAVVEELSPSSSDALPPKGSFPDEAVLDRAVRALARRARSPLRIPSAGQRSRARGARGRAERRARDAGACGVCRRRAVLARTGRTVGHSGYGDDWIRADLDAQGVTAEVAAHAIAGLEPEAERAPREWAKAPGRSRRGANDGPPGFAEETLEALLARDPSTGVG